MVAIRRACVMVAAFALGLGITAMAQAQCPGNPCFHVDVNAEHGPGDDNQFSASPFSISQHGSNNGNQEDAFGIAQLGSVGSKTSAEAVACPTPNCFDSIQAVATGEYVDVFDLASQGYTDGESFVFSLSLNGSFGLASSSDGGFPQVGANAEFVNANNVGFANLGGNPFFPPMGTATMSVTVYPSQDPLGQLELNIVTSTSFLFPLSGPATGFADFSTTFEVTNIALLDPNGNFLRNIVLTDTAGFTLPGPGPGTAPEPGTLLLVVSSLAALGTLSRRTRAS